MTKTEIINEVCYEMTQELEQAQLDRLKITLLVKMQDYDIVELRHLPAVVEHDNEWLMKRYWIDMVAAGLKESTVWGYLRAVRVFFRDTGKNYRYVTAQDITDWLAVRTYRDHISQNYKSTLYRYFSAFFGWAFRRKHISDSIMDGVDHVRMVQKKKERLTDEEIEDIRETLRTPKEKALFELMLCTGMRVSEITHLNVGDFDFQRKRVSIWGEKTSQYRTGLLTPKAVKALRNYIGDRKGNEPLFISDRAPHGRLGKSGIQSMAKNMAERGGVTRLPATVHVYRKTFASVLYRKTKNVLLVSKLLGHAKVDMTVKYYLVDDLEDMQYQYSSVS